MDLHTISSVVRPAERSELPVWREGDAWLAGGTWIFSEPQRHLHRLINLEDLKWPALNISDDALEIAATCTVGQLEALQRPSDWRAAPVIGQCCRAFLASFKVLKMATVGGNICMSLPAGPMISLTAAFDGVCTIWLASGGERKIRALDFVTGDQRNVLATGDLLRRVDIPLAALRQRAAFRKISLTSVGRSAALLIGTADAAGQIALTVTASTVRPVQLVFPSSPSAEELRHTIEQQIPDTLYHTDVHGDPVWRKQMTLRLAQEIADELAGVPRS
jgi:CO/xanthine dehydrogenase FAD-binding subunit